MALTQTQLVTAVADRSELSKADAKHVITALEDIILEEIGNAQKVRIGGLVQLTVRVKPATKSRKGRNVATGEEITTRRSRRASTSGRGRPRRARPRKRCRHMVQKARRRLARSNPASTVDTTASAWLPVAGRPRARGSRPLPRGRRP